MSSSVHLDEVSKMFGDTRALDGVSLIVEPGELVALLGGSGCGKTTLLRAVAGLTQLDSGRVRIGDRDVTGVPTRHRPIGMVFQHYALFPNLDVAGNVSFPLQVRRPRSGRDIRARTAELLELVGLAGYEARYPHELSGGQQQRVALARALAPEPEVLLLDEPLSALDAVIRANLRDEIRRIQQRVGTTALFVTHDQSEAMAIADRVAVMSDGRIEEIAAPPDIWERPASKVAALFVGGRNALELPVAADRTLNWGAALAVAAPAEANGRALVVFRATDVELVEQGGMEATVEVRAFLGAMTRLQVVSGDGGVVSVEVPSSAAMTLTEGTTVRLRVDPERVQIFPVEA